jgi:Flp pilus assembly protein TadD
MEVAVSTSFRYSPFRILTAAFLAGTALALTGCGDVLVNTVASRNSGISQYNAGQYAEAAGTFRTTLRSNPADYGSVCFLGACMAKMGSYEQAIEKYKATLVMMSNSMVGRDDRPFRLQCLEWLADAFVASKDRDPQTALVAGAPASENQFLLAKINRGWGDADAALEAYAQASLLAPKDFEVAREYGLYLARLGQTEKARTELRRAYALNTNDAQVAMGLRTVGIIPGPSLKNEKDMVKPIIPVGPIPEMQIVFPASDRTSRASGATDEQ